MIITSMPPTGGNPEYVASVGGGGSFPPNYTETLQTGPRGAVVVGTHTNNDNYFASAVRIGGTEAKIIDEAQRWKLFAVTGLPTGSTTVEIIWSSPGNNFAGNFAVMSFAGVTKIGTPQITTTTPITLTGSGKLAAGMWMAGGIRTATEGDVLRVVSPRLNDNVAIHATTSDDAVMGLTQPQRGACFWLT